MNYDNCYFTNHIVIIKDTCFSSCIQAKHKYSHLFVTKYFGKQLPHSEELSENKLNKYIVKNRLKLSYTHCQLLIVIIISTIQVC